jgi:hypothetical protein
VKRFQKVLIAFFTFIGGLYFFLEFLLPEEINGFKFGAYHEQILKGIQVIGIMAIGLGILSIVRIHSKIILSQRKGWINSVALLLGFILMLFFQGMSFSEERISAATRKKLETDKKFLSLIFTEKETKPISPRLAALNSDLHQIEESLVKQFGENPERQAAFLAVHTKIAELSVTPSEETKAATISSFQPLQEKVALDVEKGLEATPAKRATELFNKGLFVPLGSAMFALLAFYIANAAYRSFRIRSKESFLLMAAAVIVMLGQIPQGPMYISESLPAIRLWLLKNISTPAFRAIFFGSQIAALAMALRIWFSLERSPLTQEERGSNE